MTAGSQGGFMVVNKPPGPTSHDVVAAVRRALHTREVGHTGTLDPFASGVLVVMVGQATRAADLVGEGRKRYRATARLGVATTTDDRTGEVLTTFPVRVLDDEVRRALGAWVGEIMQVPPAFSAKHVDGDRAHALARRGAPVELPPVPVTVYGAQLVGRDGDDVTFTVDCGRGTYIRSLARDLGRALGCGAHLVALSREAVGSFTRAEAVAAEAISPASLQPALTLAHRMPRVDVDAPVATAVWQGHPLRAGVVGARAWEAGQGGVVVHGALLVALARAKTTAPAGAAVGPGVIEVGRRFPAPVVTG